MSNVLTAEQAMTVVKENGYSLILKDRGFYIDPPDGLEKIADALNSLKDEMLLAKALMDRAITWADNDIKQWGSIEKLMKKDWDVLVHTPTTPRGALVDWAANRTAYSRGLQHARTPDISFYSRVVARIEEKIPEALAQEKKIAAKLDKRITRL